jgi:hypothetical protein
MTSFNVTFILLLFLFRMYQCHKVICLNVWLIGKHLLISLNPRSTHVDTIIIYFKHFDLFYFSHLVFPRCSGCKMFLISCGWSDSIVVRRWFSIRAFPVPVTVASDRALFNRLLTAGPFSRPIFRKAEKNWDFNYLISFDYLICFAIQICQVPRSSMKSGKRITRRHFLLLSCLNAFMLFSS